MHRKFVAVLVGAALFTPVAASSGADPAAHIAKSCRSGYTHAVMPDGSHKCLHAGEFCSRKAAWQRVYHRHGFTCRRNGHLYHR